MSLLSLNNIKAGYGKFEVLKGLSLEVEEGEVIALLGWNGAGKSTCLKTIAGLLKPISGELWFDGKRINGLCPREIHSMGITFAMQNHRCFTSMTVKENLFMGALLLSKKEVKSQIELVLNDFTDLRHNYNKKAKELSGGIQQQLSIAMVLVIHPRILLTDEPSHGLDPFAKENFIVTFKKLTESGTAILMAEQNREFVKKLAKRTYWIEDGKIKKY